MKLQKVLLARVTLLVAIAIFVAALGWSIASAEPVRREIIAPPLDSTLGMLAAHALDPPPRWPPPGKPDADAEVPASPCRRGATSRARSRAELVGKLNLNYATVDQLQMLPGVGPRKAELILRWRKRHGSFRRVLDLRRVRGFGRRSVARLSRHLTVEGPSNLRRQAIER